MMRISDRNGSAIALIVTGALDEFQLPVNVPLVILRVIGALPSARKFMHWRGYP